MPVYLFTYHALGSWLPDHPSGYVKRKAGVQPTNKPLGAMYRAAMTEPPIHFDAALQQTLLELTRQAMSFVECRLYAAATEPTHLHTLVSWRDEARNWLRQRTRIKRALTIGMKAAHGERRYFSDGASREQVQEQDHFDYLVSTYLPDHGGWKYDESRGLYKVK
jgi:hypothetical protein